MSERASERQTDREGEREGGRERVRSVLFASDPQRQLCRHHRCLAGTWNTSASVPHLERVAVQALHPLDVRDGVLRHPGVAQSTLDVSARAYLLVSPGRSSPPPSAYPSHSPPRRAGAPTLGSRAHGRGCFLGCRCPHPPRLSLGRPQPGSPFSCQQAP